MAVQNKAEVIDILQQQHCALAELGVQRCGLFGSFVKNVANPNSDVDLLIEFIPAQKTFDHLMQLGFLLEDLMGRRVDLVTTESLSPYIAPHILAEVEYV